MFFNLDEFYKENFQKFAQNLVQAELEMIDNVKVAQLTDLMFFIAVFNASLQC